MAKPVALDLKQFKHKSSDDKTTTLVHKDGHTITLAHKALSPENQQQLAALAKLGKSPDVSELRRGEAAQDKQARGPQMMADGGIAADKEKPGVIESMWNKLTEEPPKPNKDAPGYVNRDLNYGKAKGFQKGFTGIESDAKGGMVKDSDTSVEADTAAEGVSKANKIREHGDKKPSHGITIKLPDVKQPVGKVKMMADGGDVPEALAPSEEVQAPPQLEEAMQFDPNKMPDMNKPYLDAYEQIKKHNQLANPGQSPVISEQQALDAALRAKSNDEADAANAKKDQQADALAANHNIAEQNAKRQALGLSPLPLASIPQDQSSAAAQERSTAGMPQKPAVDPNASFTPQYGQPEQKGMPGVDQLAGDYYNKGMAAAAGQAKVQEEQGRQQEAAYQQKLSQETDLLDHYQQAGDQLNSERAAIKADIANGHIDPDKFWTGYTAANGDKVAGHNKVAAGIGMILAGFNPTNRPNAAIEMLNKQMDMGLEAQKQNLNSSHNLLSANLAQYKNLTDATMATRLQMNDAMQDKLGAAAAKATTAGAKNAALQAQSQLAQQAIPLAQTLQMRKTLMDLNSSGNKTPGSVGKGVQYMTMLNSEAGKEMQSRYYPPDDVLANKPIPQEVMNKLSAHHDLDNSIRDLYDFVQTHNTLLPNTPDYVTGQQKALALQTKVREGMLNTVYREGEQPLLDKFINSNPAGMMKSLKTMPQLNELLGNNSRSMNTLKQDYGIPVKQQAPLNNQAQPQIKTVNGVKYMRGPDGKAIPVK